MAVKVMMLVAQHSGFQRSLFTSTQEKLIADMSVSADEMASWHSKEWLSFNPLTLAHYDEGERIEVQFMKGLAHSGLSDAMINDRVDQGQDHLGKLVVMVAPGIAQMPS